MSRRLTGITIVGAGFSGAERAILCSAGHPGTTHPQITQITPIWWGCLGVSLLSSVKSVKSVDAAVYTVARVRFMVPRSARAACAAARRAIGTRNGEQET
jgi:hypothetical protein